MSNKDKAQQAQINAEANNQPAPAPQATAKPEENGNRWLGLFEGINFQPSNSDRQFANQDGSVSKRVASFVLTFHGGFGGVCGNVYARRTKGSKKAFAEASFVGTRSTQALAAYDESSKAELNAVKAHVAGEYAKWRASQTIVPTVKAGAVEVEGIEFADE